MLHHHKVILDKSSFYERTPLLGNQLIEMPQNLFARTLVTCLAKLWTRLMGWKSLTRSASSFLGSKVIKAELRRQRFLKSLLQTAETAAMTSL
jgi:hypothetical protein